MLGRPREPYPAALEMQLVVRGFHILAHSHQLFAMVETHDVAGRLSYVDDLFHDPGLDGHARRGCVVLAQHVQLFRADDEADTISRQQVRDADEPGHEFGRGPLVDLDRRAHRLGTAVCPYRRTGPRWWSPLPGRC